MVGNAKGLWSINIVGCGRGGWSDRLCTGPIKSSVLEDYWENGKVQLIYSIICIKWNTQTIGGERGREEKMGG